jgi:purine-cytosine permease-like protein
MVGSAGPHFDFSTRTESSTAVLNAKRISFFSLCLSVGLSWAPLAADYYVYYPSHVKRWRTFAVTVLGCGQAMVITLILGVGLGTMVASSPTYALKYGTDPGGLLMTAYDSLGGFGKFCAVINVLALVASNTPGSYSMGMNFQMLGGFFQRVPRPIFTTLSTVIYTACAMGGRNSLYEIFKGFLPLIGYWVIIWFMIVLEEDVIFRRKSGYDWTAWNNPQKLPKGIAAAISFLIGWAGAILGMVSFSSLGPIGNRSKTNTNNSIEPIILQWYHRPAHEWVGSRDLDGSRIYSAGVSSTEDARIIAVWPVEECSSPIWPSDGRMYY